MCGGKSAWQDPVLFNFHGYESSADQQMAYADFRPLAERDTFLVVAPNGQGRPRHFNLLGVEGREPDDVEYALLVLDELESGLCVDPRRVYSTGMSNGGAMTSVLACRASDRFAAFGAVAAVVWAPVCEDARPLAIAAFMGTADRIVPFHGGTVNCCGRPTIPSTPGTMANWARHNRCEPDPGVEAVAPDVEARRWTGCAPGAATELYVLKGGGHVWPSAEIDATSVLWDFFRGRSRPRGHAAGHRHQG